MATVNDVLNQLRLRNIFKAPISDESMGVPNTWSGERQGGTPNPYVMSLGEKQDPFLPKGSMTQPVDTGPAKPIQPQQDEAMRAFMLSLGEMPTREQGKPSNWRKLGAGIVGAGQGMDQGNKFLNRPYTEKVEDWKLKSGTLGQAAQLERLNNAQISQEEYRRLTDQWRIGKLEADIADDKAKNELAADRNIVAQRNAAVREQALQGGIIKIDEQGNAIMVRKNGMVEKLPNLDMFSDAEKEKMMQEGRMEVVRQQGANAIAAAGVPRQVNTTGSTTVTTTGGGNQDAILPSQEKVRQYTNAQEAYNSHPEWRPFITLRDPGANEFDITPPSAGWFGTSIGAGPDVEEWKKLVAFIKGNNPAPTPGTAAPKVTTSERNTNTTSSRGGTPVTPTPQKGDKVGSPITPPPPVAQRKIGLHWVLPNVGEKVWDGTAWTDLPGVK